MVVRLNNEERQVWADRIQEWNASGENAAAWCRKQNINYDCFFYWKKKILFPDKVRKPSLRHLRSNQDKTNGDAKQSTTVFLEMKESYSSEPAIVIESQGIKILVSTAFEEETLFRCLRVLRRL